MCKNYVTNPLDKSFIARRLTSMILHQYGSVAQCALRNGIPLHTLYKVTRGEVMPSAYTLAILSQCLDCSVDYLLGLNSADEDPVSGYEVALLNICEHRSRWPRSKVLFLIYAAMNALSPEEKNKIRLLSDDALG